MSSLAALTRCTAPRSPAVVSPELRRLGGASEDNMDTFESLIMDLLGDAGIYMEHASKSAASSCPDCKGAGKTPTPEIGSREMYMQMLAAFAKDAGGSSTVQISGDDCLKCGATGKIYDDSEILTRAALAAAKDYRDDMRIALATSNAGLDAATASVNGAV